MLRDQEKRIAILDQVNQLLDTYCDGCTDPNRIKHNDSHNKNAYYCTNVCQHGKEIRKLGVILEGDYKRPNKIKRPDVSTYYARKELGLTETAIAKQYGVSKSTLLKWKHHWGVLSDAKG